MPFDGEVTHSVGDFGVVGSKWVGVNRVGGGIKGAAMRVREKVSI